MYKIIVDIRVQIDRYLFLN